MSTVQTSTQDRNNNSAQRGGQASLGLFGTPGFNAPRQPLLRCQPHASHIKGALNSYSLTPAHHARSTVAAAKVQSALLVVPVRRTNLDDEPQLAYDRWLADVATTYGCMYDEEAAAYARSFAGAGMAEHMMAVEG